MFPLALSRDLEINIVMIWERSVGWVGEVVKEVQQELSGSEWVSHPCALTLNHALLIHRKAVQRRVVSFSRYALCTVRSCIEKGDRRQSHM